MTRPPLKEKNGIVLTVLGSGTAAPSLERSSSALIARIKEKQLLFDMGPGTTRRILEAGMDVFQTSFLFLTHFHPDHSGELASFLFSLKYANDTGRNIPLTIIGGKGLLGFYRRLNNVYGHWIEPAGSVPRFIEMDNGRADFLSFGEFTVKSMPVDHNDESIAFRIADAAGNSFVYSGDTDYCESLIELSDHTGLLICECSFPEGHKVKGHLTPGLAGKIATKGNVHGLVLTHFYPECDEADIEKQCQKTYDGPLTLARDLMTLNVTQG
jgi:ribonuclease BN (tRNA processing enzyme)